VPPLILGIETSCDETAASVVDGGARVLSNVVASQYALHAEYAGVVPEIASRAHVEALLPVVREALEEAGVGLGRIDAIAVANRPGLIGSLLVGVAGAKALAWSLGKPLIGVDHVQAHLYSGVLDAPLSPSIGTLFPALGLVVSGGHTAMYELDSWTDVRRIAGTIDDAVGEAYDKVGAMLGLTQPGGPSIDRLAQQPGARDDAYDFPVARIAPGSLEFSFSGLKTSVLYAVRGVPQQGGGFARDARSLSPDEKRDIAASFQRAACRAITLKISRALDARAGAGAPALRTLLVGGGVSANSRMRHELALLAHERGLALRMPLLAYCGDNAAMIAGLAHHLSHAGQIARMDLAAMPMATHQ
jgi:N6-L-threonylcarbamoyladenine synthase